MKQTILNLTMAGALILGAAAMSSCAGFVDALLGHEDNPAEAPAKPTTSDVTADDNGDNEMSLPPGAGANIIDLSTLTKDFTAQDGDVLTGTLDGEKTIIKLSVADGATVILSNAQILGGNYGQKVNQWAGLTCLGSATIILDGEDTVRSYNRDYPCIQIGSEKSTLIIKGDSKLTTEGNSSAGIGSAVYMACGDIEIQGGDITLNDSNVGIGSYSSSCGDITITGGTITAQGHDVGVGNTGVKNSCGNITITGGTITAQGWDGPGIGLLKSGSCGGISCGEDFVSLTVIRGNSTEYPIGGPDHLRCGKITFERKVIKSKNSVVYGWINGMLKVTISTTLPEGVNEEDEDAVKSYKDNNWTLKPIC